MVRHGCRSKTGIWAGLEFISASWLARGNIRTPLLCLNRAHVFHFFSTWPPPWIVLGIQGSVVTILINHLFTLKFRLHFSPLRTGKGNSQGSRKGLQADCPMVRHGCRSKTGIWAGLEFISASWLARGNIRTPLLCLNRAHVFHFFSTWPPPWIVLGIQGSVVTILINHLFTLKFRLHFSPLRTGKGNSQGLMKRDTRRLPDGQAWMPIEDRHLGWPRVYLCKLACKSKQQAHLALSKQSTCLSSLLILVPSLDGTALHTREAVPPFRADLRSFHRIVSGLIVLEIQGSVVTILINHTTIRRMPSLNCTTLKLISKPVFFPDSLR